MAAPPRPSGSPRGEAIYPADVLRVGALLRLDASALATAVGVSARELERWLASSEPLPASWREGVERLAASARRIRHLYLSADVRRLRALALMTQAELAREIGVDRVTIAQWEAGHRVPTGRRVDALLEFERRLLERPPVPNVRECARCGRTYPRTERFFHRNGAARDGLHSVCRGCRTGSGEDYWLRKYGSIL